MRLLYWTPLYWPSIGGVEVISAKLLAGLRARGYEVRVVTSPGHLDLPEEDERDGIPIYRLPFHRALESLDPFLIHDTQRRLAQLKREFKPDVVHVTPTDPSTLFHVRTAAAYPSKIVAALHMPVVALHCGPETLFGRLVRGADWVTTVSVSQLSALRLKLPETMDRSSVVLNGMEPPALPPGPLPTEAPRLLCIGRLTAQKGFERAIAAFARIADRFPKARLVIAGDSPDREALEQLARELGIMDRTDFLGWIRPDRVPSLMDGATMVVMPSRFEGLPLVAIEAAQMARPVVASAVDGLPEVVVDGETGVLVDAEDVAALTGAVASLLENPRLAARMGSAARERALDLFGGERCIAQYDHLYQHLTREPVYADAR